MVKAPFSTAAMRGSVETCALGAVEPVNGAELVAQVAEQRLRIEPAAHRPLEQLAGQVLASVPVDVLAQPFPQRAELARPHLLVEIRQLRPDALPQLGR